MNKIGNKKRIMYMSGEDFYFFTYSTLIILKELKCIDGRIFRDYRKLPFVVDIISDQYLMDILVRNDFGRIKNPLDRKRLLGSYTNCRIRTSEYLKLLFSLEKQGYVTLSSSKKNSQIDVALNKSSISKEFFNSELFDKERDMITALKSNVNRVSSITLETLIGKIYHSEGASKWVL